MDKTGQLVEFQSVARDVTNIRQALENLRRSEERFREVFENDLTANLVSTVDGQVVDCNAAFVRLFGFPSREAARRTSTLALFDKPETRKKFLGHLRREKKLENYEWETRRLDGKPLSLIANAVGVFDEQGELNYIRSFLFDNTELKSLQKQFLHAQKMEAMGQLAGGVAHDFNNLLTVISGYSQHLLQSAAEEPLRNCLEQIVRAADQAAALTGQLLTFSRRQVRQARELSLNQVTADLEDMLRRLLTADIELSVIRDPRLGLVQADHGQIGQVIVNLVVNARDAMPNGGKLTVETLNMEFGEGCSQWLVGLKPGPYVMLSVTDTGVGMDGETMSRIFEPFFTTKDKGKGTGLGLSTVYGIVQQSGGQVYVSSEPGLGTTFNVCFPRIEGTGQARQEGPVPLAVVRGAETVLLVEDNDAVRGLAHMILQGSGYTVQEARNAGEAIEVYENSERPIDVLVTDVIMPGRSGASLAAELKSRQPGLKLLLVSGYPQDALEDQSIWEAGAHFLQKPFSPDSLGSKMREVLGGGAVICPEQAGEGPAQGESSSESRC
jgi:PAS domain S-box-containing protein